MRFNLVTESHLPLAGQRAIPVSLTLKPACGLPGDYQYETDSSAIIQMLKRDTDLPSSVIQNFENSLYALPTARLLGVNLSDELLNSIGYFVE